jgi:hypothetical protein
MSHAASAAQADLSAAALLGGGILLRRRDA